MLAAKSQANELNELLTVLYICVQVKSVLKNRKNFIKLVDPLLQGRCPMGGLKQAVAIAAMCVQTQASARPLIGEIVDALTYMTRTDSSPKLKKSMMIE